MKYLLIIFAFFFILGCSDETVVLYELKEELPSHPNVNVFIDGDGQMWGGTQIIPEESKAFKRVLILIKINDRINWNIADKIDWKNTQ